MGAFKRRKIKPTGKKYKCREKNQKLHTLGFHFYTDNINDRRTNTLKSLLRGFFVDNSGP